MGLGEWPCLPYYASDWDDDTSDESGTGSLEDGASLVYGVSLPPF